MKNPIFENFDIRHRIRGKALLRVRKYSAEVTQASDFFDIIITKLKECNTQNCELETIYKNAMSLGDLWVLGTDDFKTKVSNNILKTDENPFLKAFVDGAKVSGIGADPRTAAERAADLEKLKKLYGFGIEVDEHSAEKEEVKPRHKTSRRDTWKMRLSLRGSPVRKGVPVGSKAARAHEGSEKSHKV